jgi:small basic protein
MDDGTFGGTALNGFTVTASNVATVFTTAMQKLRLKNVLYSTGRFQGGVKLEVPEGMPAAAISPEILTYIELYLGGKDTLLGDKVSTNGYNGYFMGFELFLSNSLPWTGSLGLATQPTDGDTVIINGVTFTFKTTLGSTAGNVLIGASADAAATNLAALVNAPGTTTAQGVAITAANQKLLKNITATANNSVDTVTFVSAGWGTVVVAETLTAAADIWTLAKQQLHAIFALTKSVSLVIQKTPDMEENPVSGKIGRDFIAWTVYGINVFTDQAPQIVQLSVNASSFTSAATLSK